MVSLHLVWSHCQSRPRNELFHGFGLSQIHTDERCRQSCRRTNTNHLKTMSTKVTCMSLIFTEIENHKALGIMTLFYPGTKSAVSTYESPPNEASDPPSATLPSKSLKETFLQDGHPQRVKPHGDLQDGKELM